MRAGYPVVYDARTMPHALHRVRFAVFFVISFALPVTFCIADTTGAELPEPSPLQWPAITRTAKPWTRWWWLGNAVDKENLSRELTAIQDAGIGGVEVTCIYGVQGQDAREIQYLSPRWVDMLRHTCAEASRLDMGVDLPPGSGWCIGGPQLPDDLSNANVVITTTPADTAHPLKISFQKSLPQAVIAFAPNSSPISLSDKIDAAGNLAWSPPPGAWTVYTVSQKFSGQKVKRPAPGGEGRAFNPFSKAALDAGLKPFDTLFAELPDGAIRSQFHDSYEYQGDWTAEVFTEFKHRIGYDLRDHLPAFTGKGDADEILRVRADYRRLIGELLLDNVISRWADKAHAHHQLARNQAHGSPGNLLDLYAAADIPETEVFRNDQDPLVARFASSAAHVAGHPLCSSETFTWMSEHFTETLGDMKHEADFLFASGINHIFYHGTAYSPADAPWPGWCFYASTEMNPRNPIWRDVPALNHYFARCQSTLQQGVPDNDILLYWPVSDVYQSTPGDLKHLLPKLSVHSKFWLADLPFGDLAAKLLTRGYTFDFVSDRQLMTAKVDADHRVVLSGGKYATLLIPRTRFMPPETFHQIRLLSDQSASVIFHGDFPTDVPGFADLDARRTALKTDALALDANKQRPAIHLTDADLLSKALAPRRESMADHKGVMFNRRAVRFGHQYFICNHGGAPINEWITLAVPAETVLLFDPMTDRIGAASVRKSKDNTAEIYLQLPPGGSVIVRALAQKLEANRWTYSTTSGHPIPLTTPWQLHFIEGGPTLPADATLNSPRSWVSLQGETTERFAGTARYTTHFDAPLNGDQFWLELGEVNQSARVKLTGCDLGTVLMAPYRVFVDHLQAKDNLLEVEVTSVAANRIRDMDRHGVKWRIFKDINLVNINYKPFDASPWPLNPAGLIGPVTLQPIKVFFDPK
jgi:hypothetical protein